MKWAIVGLCALGLLAAGAAAVLVASLQGSGGNEGPVRIVERVAP